MTELGIHPYRVRWLLPLTVLAFLFPPLLRAQTSQQHVYASQSQSTSVSFLSGYDKDSQTAGLSAISGTPFGERFEGGLLAIDGQGKFLFVLNPQSNTISMFQINQSTGALAEVPNSPFATGSTINPSNAPSLPISIAAESSGKYLYVGYRNGNVSPNAAITPFSIDAANLQLVLTPQLSFDITGTPLQMLADPKGLRLYVGLGPNAAAGYNGADTTVYSIDAASGDLFPLGNAAGGSEQGRCIAMDPQGRFFYQGSGQFSGSIEGGVISPVDGTGADDFTVPLGANNLPLNLLIESSGKYLYVQENSGLFVYSIDSTSGQLTQQLGPLVTANLAAGESAADPSGSFLYSLDQNGIHVFQIDLSTGNIAEISGSPFSVTPDTALGSSGLAISGTPGQAITGPVAQLFPTSQDMGQIAIGQHSGTKVISLANTGGQTLAISGISLTGPNAGDFSLSNTCAATLAANANCSISLEFTPSVAGPEQATLQVADNAPGSPQSAAITGTGVQGKGEVTLVPGSVDFGTVTQGASPASQTVTLTNSGTARLAIASISLGGANPGDFSQTNNCAGAALNIQASCSITVTFSPQAQGQRSATITITDDGSGSPQNLTVTGNAASPFQIVPTGSASTSATVSAGQTAQFSLQLAPGAGYTGTVNFSCAGAPVAAVCSVTPPSLTVAGTAPASVSVSVTTTGSASSFLFGAPRSDSYPPEWLPGKIVAILLWALLVFYCCELRRRFNSFAARRRALQFASVLIFVLFLGGIAGCGGASSAPLGQIPPPQQTVTPSGTSSLVVTASAPNLPPQTITLTLTVR